MVEIYEKDGEDVGSEECSVAPAMDSYSRTSEIPEE